MRTHLISTVALAAFTLGSATAFAQSSSGSSSGTGSGGATSPQTSQTNMNRPSAAMTQDRLRQVLSQAGFQDVQIVDAAYLVQARTKDGDAVLMMINPPDMKRGTASAANPSSTGSTGSPGSTSGTSGAAGGAKQ